MVWTLGPFSHLIYNRIRSIMSKNLWLSVPKFNDSGKSVYKESGKSLQIFIGSTSLQLELDSNWNDKSYQFSFILTLILESRNWRFYLFKKNYSQNKGDWGYSANEITIITCKIWQLWDMTQPKRKLHRNWRIEK